LRYGLRVEMKRQINMCQFWNSFINSYQRVDILGVVLTYTTLDVAVLSTQYAVGAFIIMSLIVYYIWDI
jgi:hypothetical protein